jgi:hypothetical protein
LLLTFYGNNLWFMGSLNFSLHCAKNYDSHGSDTDHDEAKEAKKEPGGAAPSLVAGLGDAEGTEEGSGERLKELHGLMVRGREGGGAIFGVVKGEGQEESTTLQGHPIGKAVVACCNRRSGLD